MVLDNPPLRGDALHQRIQARITRFIIERGFRPGDPLPAEADLARTLGISRPSLREAMKALQILGVIEARHGSGTYVGRFSLDPLVDGLAFRIRIDLNQNVQTIRELVEIRLVLESSLVARVAAVRTDLNLAPADTAVTAADHRRILDSLVAGDGEAASAAMTIHFNGIQSRIQEPVPGGREPQ